MGEELARQYIATFYILTEAPKLPRHVVGLDAIVLNQRFTALTEPEARELAKARIASLKLEYANVREIKLVLTEPAADYTA